MNVTRELLHALPKTELHVHLDGSLRPETMLELAKQYGKQLPASDAESLLHYMRVDDARNLVDYLARFETTLSLLQQADALERTAYELAEDAALENVRYLEVRYSPVLNTREGLTLEGAVDASLRGLRRAEQEFDIITGVIVCALRHLSAETSLALARLAVDYKHKGVVGFDLAGPEEDHPPKRHLPAFELAADANLAITIHAGEAFGPRSIHQALHRCHARRIGHGTHLRDDPDLLAYVRDFRIPLEICLTSNVQTRAALTYDVHPLRSYYDAGLVLALSTDNRLMSGTTVTEEYWRAHQHLGFEWEELCDLALIGFEAAFMPHPAKVDLIEEIAIEIQTLSEAMSPT
jgi:adenosine deaminase